MSKKLFELTLDELMNLKRKTIKQKEFIKSFYDYSPVIMSDSTMNMVCKYIESINFEIKNKISSIESTDFYNLYKNNKVKYTKEEYDYVKGIIEEYILISSKNNSNTNSDNSNYNIIEDNSEITLDLLKMVNNSDIYINCLVDYFYLEKPNIDKSTLWLICGEDIYNNVKINTKGNIKFPMVSDKGNILYLGKKYSWKEVTIG